MTLNQYAQEVASAVDGLDEAGRAEFAALHADGLLGTLEALGHHDIDPESTQIGPILKEAVRWLEMVRDAGFSDAPA